MSTPESPRAAPPKKITRKVVERFELNRNVVLLECGHSAHEPARLERGEPQPGVMVRCLACEAGEPAPGSETA